MILLHSWTWRLLLPITLAIIGVWALAGCFYLPIPEHRVNGKQKDFTKLVGPKLRSPAIHQGMTRAQVIALLGNTPHVSLDNMRMAYFLDTEDGFWVWPLCFSAYSDHRHVYMLIIAFDAQDRIEDTLITNEIGNGGDWLNNSAMDFASTHKDLLLKDSHFWPAATEPAGQ